MSYAIGDCLTELRKLDAGFAQTCVTSPPYWGLRDYGTATWDGGDSDCDHLRPPLGGFKAPTLDCAGDGLPNGMSNDVIKAQVMNRSQQYRQTCAKCGATRVDMQVGLEETPEAYVERMVEIFAEVKRVLRDDGTLWINLGDSYAAGGMSNPSASSTLDGGKDRGAAQYAIARSVPANLKPKDLVGIPWRVAFALQADGWYLRSDIIWSKPNPMPESVTDRPTKAHEYIFLLSKSSTYHYDADAIREQMVTNGSGGVFNRASKHSAIGNQAQGADSRQRDDGRNKRSVWRVPSIAYSGAHFACFPPKLIEPCIMAGAPMGGMVLDPFLGSGTTGMVAEALGRKWFGIELNPDYEPLIKKRTAQLGLFGNVG